MNNNPDKSVKNIVKVIALHNNRLVIVKQLREGIEGYTFELPGGKVNGNEDLLSGAIRELQEETGLITNELIELGTFVVPSGTVVVTLFFTNKIIGKTQQNLDKDEKIEVLEIHVDDAFKKVGNGEWKDIRLGMGLILARAKGLLNQSL